MTPRQRNRAADWIGFALIAVMVINGLWTAGLQ